MHDQKNRNSINKKSASAEGEQGTRSCHKAEHETTKSQTHGNQMEQKQTDKESGTKKKKEKEGRGRPLTSNLKRLAGPACVKIHKADKEGNAGRGDVAA